MKTAPSTTQFVSVDYAYPTSETATRHGYGKTGCYGVYIDTRPATETSRPRNVAAFPTREQATAHARTLNLPWLWPHQGGEPCACPLCVA